MDDKLNNILKLVDEYITEKHQNKIWTPGVDWVQYAGTYYNSNEYTAAIKSLLNEWFVLGTDAITFERDFPKYFNKIFGIVTNSGSSGNLLMMLAMTSKNLYNLPKGTKVITPVAGFPTTLNPTLQVGFEPLFVDIELNTLNLNVDQIEEQAKKGAKILTFAHVLGNPPNMDQIMEIVNKYNLILLEDCCDALGSKYDNKSLGSFGELASCSFYPAHHISMAGEGGFVACNTKQQEMVVRAFREWGRSCYCVGKKANLLKNGSCGIRFSNWLKDMPTEIFDHKYVYSEIGYNLKPIELQCSVGLEQLKKLPEIIVRRKQNYAKLLEIFSPYEEFFILPKATNKSDPAWFAFPLTIKNPAIFNRHKFCNFLEESKIQTRTYFGGNFLLQPAYSDLKQGRNPVTEFPIATKVTTDTFFMGTSPVIKQPQLDYIKEKVDLFFKKI